MPVITKTKGGKSVNSMAGLLGVFQKDFGEDIGNFGGTLVNSDRLPTSIFPLDLALAGGLPHGKVSVIYGPESSSKTNIALMTIAAHQLMFPDKVCVFFDIENSFDPAWARLLGVDTTKLVVIRPSYGEQVVDMAESALYTDDCGIVVIDSLAALLTTSELQASAERSNVGGSTLLIGKLVRKTTLALSEADKKGRQPTLIYINQVRSKVGVVYGNPETMPGGNAPKFQANIILRVYGKNEMDTKVSSTMPVKKEVKFVISKWKCPILSAGGTFSMATLPHQGLKVGQCADFNTVSEYLKSFGQFEKDAKKGWVILGQHYPVIDEFKTRLYNDPAFGADVRKQIIDKMAQGGDLLQSQDDDAAEEDGV